MPSDGYLSCTSRSVCSQKVEQAREREKRKTEAMEENRDKKREDERARKRKRMRSRLSGSPLSEDLAVSSSVFKRLHAQKMQLTREEILHA